MSKLKGSKKATQFTESVIREMTRLNHLYGGVNLSQGFPDFPAPQAIKDAACAAIAADVNQYAVTWGARPLREAVAREFTRRYGVPIVADEQVTVCCGSSEAVMATMMAILDRGALPQVGRDRHLRRDLRAHRLRRPEARADCDDRGDGGPHDYAQRFVEDLQRHRMARRMDDFAAVTHRRHSEGARFPHGGSGC